MQKLTHSGCGKLVPIGEGMQAFVPDPLPQELNRLESTGLVRHDNQTWPPLYIADEILDALQAPIDLAQL